MRATTLLRTLLALKQTHITGFEFTTFGLEIDVEPRTRVPYCSACLRRARHVYDHRPRTWRHLDFGACQVWLEAAIHRVDCRGCGRVRTEQVPWARPNARHSSDFENVAWLAQRMDKTASAG